MANYLIGDIQGCYQSFRKLLKTFQFDPQQDRLYLAGDLINRGPESLATMEYVLTHQSAIQAVLGNHDLHFLAVAYETRAANPKDTLDQLLASSDRDTIIHWLEKQPLVQFFDTENCLLSHAGLPPFWSVKQALDYSREISQVISSSQNLAFYRAMYGDEPRHWQANLKGNNRNRLITNILTRMRYLDHEQGLDLSCKKPLEQQDHGLSAWFEFPNQHFQGKIAFGHWAALQGKTPSSRLIALDTGCVWGGKLTAYRLEDGVFFQVEAAE